MKNDFNTSFVIPARAQEVFDAVNNVRGWWSENIDGDTDRLHAEFSYHYQDVHRARMKITMLEPGKVVWHVLENDFNFIEDKQEWVGTDIIFEITQEGDNSRLSFTHMGLVPTYECFQICQDSWTHYVQDSLKALILTGKGLATPAEVAP